MTKPIATFTVHYAEPMWLKLRMTPELMSLLVEAARGRGNNIEWGEPDDEGFYTPTVTISDAPLETVRRMLTQ